MELMAHFSDGIEAGQATEQLIQTFGDENATAKLIRRAKIRNRPTIWHIKRAIIYSFATIFILYIGLLIRMFIGQPTLKVNYVDLINEKLNHVSPDQRAWPIYRQAILSLKDRPTTEPEATEWGKVLDARPGNKRWPTMVQWLEQHQRTLELIRRGSEKPVLGFVLGREGSAKDVELWPPQSAYDGATLEKDWLISVLLPHLNETRQLANVLDADIAFAREQKDGARITADLTAIARLGSQLRGNDDFVITALISLGIRHIAVNQLNRTLSESPALISDSDLQKLSHLLAIPQQTDQLITLRGERLFFYDTLQRAFTDDGNGDGRITRAGIEMLISASGPGRQPDAALLVGPVMGSRRDTLELYDYFMNKAEANFSKPYRDADWNGWLKEFMDWKKPLVHRVRYAPISIFYPLSAGRISLPSGI